MMAMLPNVYAVSGAGAHYDLCNPRKLQTSVVADDKLDKIVRNTTPPLIDNIALLSKYHGPLSHTKLRNL